MKVYLIFKLGGDMFEEHWEYPVEIFSTKEAADKRCNLLNEESISKRKNYGFRYSEFELDKAHEHF